MFIQQADDKISTALSKHLNLNNLPSYNNKKTRTAELQANKKYKIYQKSWIPQLLSRIINVILKDRWYSY